MLIQMLDKVLSILIMLEYVPIIGRTEENLLGLKKFMEEDLVQIRSTWSDRRELENYHALELLKKSIKAFYLRSTLIKTMLDNKPQGSILTPAVVRTMFATGFIDNISNKSLRSTTEHQDGSDTARAVWLDAMVNGTSFADHPSEHLLLQVTAGEVVS
jgi:hypothetical protein